MAALSADNSETIKNLSVGHKCFQVTCSSVDGTFNRLLLLQKSILTNQQCLTPNEDLLEKFCERFGRDPWNLQALIFELGNVIKNMGSDEARLHLQQNILGSKEDVEDLKVAIQNKKSQIVFLNNLILLLITFD